MTLLWRAMSGENGGELIKAMVAWRERVATIGKRGNDGVVMIAATANGSRREHTGDGDGERRPG